MSDVIEHEMLTLGEFAKRYSIKLGKSNRFITKTYYEPKDIVAIFEDEIDADCYFQLPNWQTGLVPDDRRYIYKMPAGFAREKAYVKNSHNKIEIPVSELEFFADPYTVDVENVSTVESVDRGAEDEMLNLLKKMIKCYEENRGRPS
jgi:hypothetical protein